MDWKLQLDSINDEIAKLEKVRAAILEASNGTAESKTRVSSLGTICIQKAALLRWAKKRGDKAAIETLTKEFEAARQALQAEKKARRERLAGMR